MPVIPVISASGGVGKTTISLLLAYMLTVHVHVDPRRILLVDLDPTAGLSLRVFGDDRYDEACRDRRTLYHMDLDFNVRNVRIDEYVNFPGRSAEAVSNVAVLPSGEDDKGDLSTRIEEWFRYGRRERLWDVLEGSGALSRYDYMIVDTAPFFDARYTIIAVSASERAVIPLRPTVTDVKRTRRMVTALRRHRIAVSPIFIFNFDKGRLAKEAATLASMGYGLPRPGRANPDPKLRALIGELADQGEVAASALVHYRELSDAEFPRGRLGDRIAIAACAPTVDLFRALGINAPPCPLEYEEE